MKKTHKISVCILLVVMAASIKIQAAANDTLKIMQSTGELSLVVIENMSSDEVKADLDIKSIINGFEKNKSKIGSEAVMLNGTNHNYQITKKGDFYFLASIPAKKRTDAFVVRIYEKTSKQKLDQYKEKAAASGIDIEYTNLIIVDGSIDAISMKVDCNDGFSGSLSVTDIPEEGIGFIRDYNENPTPFAIGKIFGSNSGFSKYEDEDDDDSDFDIAFNKESKVTREEKDHKIKHDHELEFLIGLNNYLTPNNELPSNNDEVYSIDPITSWTYQINSVHEVKFSKFFQTNFMFGIQWNNFALEDENYQILKGPESIVFENTTISRADINPARSKLNITYLNAGILPIVHFGKKSSSLRVGAGVYGGYRIGSKSKFKYDDNGKDVVKNNFYLNSWHYGVRAQVGWKGIDLFATYDLNSLYINNRGPELNAFSFGIIL